MRPIDADALKESLLKERDKISLEYFERYSFGCPSPNKHGEAMRGGIRKALRCMEETPTLDYAPKWISVKDRGPESSADVLVFVSGVVDIGYHMPIRKYWNCYSVNGSVTHWMPLPEPPKEDA